MSNRISTFADRLKLGMKEKGIKAVDLSKRSGISESMISCYRSGRYEATQLNLQKLAEALDVSIPWLMGYNVPIGKYDAPPTNNRVELIARKLEKLDDEALTAINNFIDLLN